MADLQTAILRFQRQAQQSAYRLFGRSAIVESEQRYNFIRIRIRVNPTTFIELYHNAQNERGSYALIFGRRRIFGYDGVKEWHRHPLDDPERHEPCRKPRLPGVLREMKRIIDSLPSGEQNV